MRSITNSQCSSGPCTPTLMA
uniref:Uncharacterized protein n=1 Tax=Anguilla anguilla TaxID=7936 RepID=A0A0E9XVT2_ANGAN